MYCCPRGTFYCQYTNEVQFENLKTKYNIDEDIMVNYTVQDKIRTSTRDWIGIFPRGWTNLQQYLTFEYVVVAPKLLSSPNRSIVLLHNFHREASPNIDYQFVYVSKEIRILGTSSYFRFVVSPSLRSLDRKPDTPEIVNDGHLPSTMSSRPIDAGRIVAKSRSIDSIVEQRHKNHGFSDQPRRNCQFCCTKFDSSFSANKAQFLSLLNEQLMARVGRLDRDLELMEAALKTEKLARMTVFRKLQAYETFVEEMFRCLNVTGFVKVRDNSRKEIIIQKVKSKELPSVVKSVPIPEVSMLHRSSEHRKWSDEETTETNKIEEILQEMRLPSEETPKSEENVIYNSEVDNESKKVSVFYPLPKERPPSDKEIPITVANIENDTACKGDSYANEQLLNAMNKEGNEMENSVNIEKDCCCDCHSSTFKMLNDGPKCGEKHLQEWVLEGECCLKINATDRMIDNVERNLKSGLKNHGQRDAPPETSENIETEANREELRSRTSTVLIKCRNAKFSVIK